MGSGAGYIGGRVRLYREDDSVTWRPLVEISRGKPTLRCHSTVFQKLLALSNC
ncbi:hypothetical protein CXB51_000043 [Gossypium anomalum]|uniref:Uncharacterized protein n=1 Tax=Gossypium anomalum TaxID=47600 RepID=A0A8J5Z9S8_9ROSI|nr:hypothetical protein CXB51_000043 [Gossypium anomalum]